MKRLITRPRSRLLAVVLAVVAALCTVSTANAASSGSETVVPAVPSNLTAQAAGPAFVQVVAVQPQTNQTTVTVTYTKAQAAGDTNVLAIGWADVTSNITKVSDSSGNTYAVAAPTGHGSA